MRRYAIESVYNMRDLGGYNTRNKQTTQYGRIFRSDCPLTFVEGDAEFIKTLNIQDVIDFRTAEEITKRPSYFSKVESVKYHNIPFVNGKDMPIDDHGVPAVYLNLMEDKAAIGNILTIIANSEGNVLYHCAVGKDRTGIISALILKLCDVVNDEIIADYQLSETYLYPLFKEIKKRHPGWPEWSGYSKSEYMRNSLEILERKYGSFEEYLNEMQIEKDVIHKIKEKLLNEHI